jgi:hypothetical protein
MLTKDFLLSILYFALSTLFTAWFVLLSPMYISQEQMFLSAAIAGGKWAIQILMGILFLEKKTILFLKKIGFVCFIGSCLLLPYVALSFMNVSNSSFFFIGSLFVSVVAMIALYYKEVRQMQLSIKWWLIWLLCLAIAISLQLTVVFHQINF